MEQSSHYQTCINHVIDYIETHLTDDFSLEGLAKIACFSKYHFLRLFHSIMGEHLFVFIQRVRVEKAAFQLMNHPHLSITDIAFQCGFNSSQAFSRAFKKHFQITASEWRMQKPVSISNIGSLSKPPVFTKLPDNYPFSYDNQVQTWKIPYKNDHIIIQVKERPAFTAAYIRYIGPYKGDSQLFQQLWNKMFRWASARHLIIPNQTQYLVLYHDDIHITQEQKLRISVCISVPENTETDNKVGKMKIKGGKYACAEFRLGADEYAPAWDWIYGCWLPESGYLPDDRFAFEYYPADQHSEAEDGKQQVQICVPVKPL